MFTSNTPRTYGRLALIFGLPALAIYLVMTQITLAHLTDLASLPPFDLRPLGYSTEDAQAFLTALGEDGRRVYLIQQLPLDVLYPPLLAATLAATFLWLNQKAPRPLLTRIGVILSVGAALFDYAENLGIALMLASWPNLPTALVFAASVTSIAKSVVTTLAILSLIFHAILWPLRPLARA